MHIHLGVEDIEPNNWVVWAFEFPGCYSRGRTAEEALAGVSKCVLAHIDRLVSLGIWSGEPVSKQTPITSEVIERHSAITVEADDYSINAFFEDDRRPIERDDVVNGLALMLLNRIELINTIRPLNSAELDRQIPRDRFGTIREILRHIATTEWWYMDRLDRAFDRERWRPDVFELLQQIREQTSAELPKCVGDGLVTEKRRELWSARKLLRRTLWHEHVHTRQIERYLAAGVVAVK